MKFILVMHDSYKKWVDDGCPKIFCECLDHEEITIKKHHKRFGIPRYIHGHNNKNKILTKETKQKISENHVGMKDKQHTKETKQKMCDNHKGMIGKQHTKETKQKMREKKLKEKNNSWKGGITPLNHTIRTSNEYSEWRLQIFGRDNFTCQCCNNRGIYLNAHHIKPFSEIIEQYNIKNLEDVLNCEILWDLNNGITYCTKCHDKLKKKGGLL